MSVKSNAAMAKKIKILLMDVDGVLTDGKMYFLPGHDGKMVEFKAFHSLDGIGLRLLNSFGVLTGVITGRESPSTEERARNLGMSYAYQGFLSKLDPMAEILKDAGLKEEDMAYIGDDVTDIPVLKKAGLACAPKNALPEVKRAAHFVTAHDGGAGAVREVCDLILKSKGLWKQVVRCVETAYWPSIAKPALKTTLYSKKCAMSALVTSALCFAPLVLSAAAIQDDDITEQFLSTGTAGSDYGAEDEEAHAQIQESDEDLTGFVVDYIKKDTALKGAFLIEDSAGKKILKLKLEAVLEKIEDGADNSKIAEAVFKDAAGKKYSVLFHLQSADFTGVDIFKIELKKRILKNLQQRLRTNYNRSDSKNR